MPKFRVEVFEEIGGFATIEAKGELDARAKAQQIMDDDGVAGFEDFDPTHRSPSVFSIEEIKEEKNG